MRRGKGGTNANAVGFPSAIRSRTKCGVVRGKYVSQSTEWENKFGGQSDKMSGSFAQQVYCCRQEKCGLSQMEMPSLLTQLELTVAR